MPEAQTTPVGADEDVLEGVGVGVVEAVAAAGDCVDVAAKALDQQVPCRLFAQPAADDELSIREAGAGTGKRSVGRAKNAVGHENPPW